MAGTIIFQLGPRPWPWLMESETTDVGVPNIGATIVPGGVAGCEGGPGIVGMMTATIAAGTKPVKVHADELTVVLTVATTLVQLELVGE